MVFPGLLGFLQYTNGCSHFSCNMSGIDKSLAEPWRKGLKGGSQEEVITAKHDNSPDTQQEAVSVSRIFCVAQD